MYGTCTSNNIWPGNEVQLSELCSTCIVGCSSGSCGQSFDLPWTCQQGQHQTDEETGQEWVWYSPRGKLHTAERQQHEKVHCNSKYIWTCTHKLDWNSLHFYALLGGL